MRRKGKEGYTGSRNDDTSGQKMEAGRMTAKWEMRKGTSQKRQEYKIKAEVRRKKVVLRTDKRERGRRGIGSI